MAEDTADIVGSDEPEVLTEEQIDNAIRAAASGSTLDLDEESVGDPERAADDDEPGAEEEPEEPEEPEKPKEDDEEQPDDKPGSVTDEIREAAKALLDLDDEDIDGLPPKVLAKMLRRAAPRREAAPATEQQSEPKSAEPEAKEEDPPADDWKLELSEDLDDGLRNAILGLKDRFSKQLSAQAKELDRLKDLEKQWLSSEVDRQAREIDSVFVALSSEFSDLVGQGSADEMSRDSAEFENRLTIFDTAMAIGSALEAQGKSVPSRERLFRMAINVAFPDLSQKQITKKLSSDLRRQQKRFSQKPTGASQRSPAARGDDAAREAVKQFVAEHGLG